MATLILDIETVGEDWDELDSVTQKALTRWVAKTARTQGEYQVLLDDIRNGLGFSPLTGYMVALGVYDLERAQGAVYYTGADTGVSEQYGDFVLKSRSELQMLTEFWDAARSYDTFVTFNGRCFDAPFLIHRSAILGVHPTRNLMEGRYPYLQKTVRHIDLQDELTFYGAMQRKGNLHLFCRAYGIASPKEQGVSGDDVAELFRRKKFRDIAVYNAHDVRATTALYEKYTRYFILQS